MKFPPILNSLLPPFMLFIVAFVCFVIPVLLNEGHLFATDQEVFIGAAENLRTRFSVIEPSPLNEMYQTSIIDSRESPYVSRHQGLISQYPPGQAFILALLKTVIPNYNLIECFLGAVGIILFYFLVKRLFEKREAIFCTIALISTPIYYFWSMFALADITAFVFILLAILVYFRAKETNSLLLYIVWAVCLGVTVWIKYPNIILIVPFFIDYVIIRPKREKRNPAFIGLVVFCFCILALLWYHKWAFGGFFTTGYNYHELKLSEAGQNGVTEQSGVSIMTLLKWRLVNISVIKQLFIKVTNLPIHIAICSPLTLLGIFGCFSLKRKEWKVFLLPFLVALLLFSFYAIFTIKAVGWEDYHRSTISSYNRYILPAYCLLMIPAVFVVRNCALKKFTIILVLITTMNLFSLGVATINSSNLNWLLAAQKEAYQLRQKHLQLTSDESVIIGRSLVFYLRNAQRHIIHCREDWCVQSPLFRKELTRVVLALLQDSRDVYVVQDYEEETLHFKDTTLELIDAETSLYKLKR